jgi:hypothetical protein
MDAISNAINQVKGNLPKPPNKLPTKQPLPIEANEELVKKKAKAAALAKKIEIDKKKLELKEAAIKTAKEKLKSLPFPSLKSVQDKLINQLEKELADERANMAKRNINSAKEIHTYPIKKLKAQATQQLTAQPPQTRHSVPKLPLK